MSERPIEPTMRNAVETHFATIGMPSYQQAIEQMHHLAEVMPGGFAVIIGDNDRLKEVNDGEDGHVAGDKIIIDGGEALLEMSTYGGFIAIGRGSRHRSFFHRQGAATKQVKPSAHHRKGDEFIIVLPGISTQDSVDAWVNVAQTKLLDKNVSMTLSGRPHQVGETIPQLLRGVDALLSFDKGFTSVDGLTIEQLATARQVIGMMTDAGISLRELPKIAGFLRYLPYDLK